MRRTMLALASGCTQATQNQIVRSIQNWTVTSGALDDNQDYQADPGERKVYFEASDHSTPYVFYESPR